MFYNMFWSPTGFLSLQMGNETGAGDRKGHCNDRKKECSPNGKVLPSHLVDTKHNGEL